MQFIAVDAVSGIGHPPLHGVIWNPTPETAVMELDVSNMSMDADRGGRRVLPNLITTTTQGSYLSARRAARHFQVKSMSCYLGCKCLHH